MKKIVINGQFTARRLTGQERFALEITKQLDKLIKDIDLDYIIELVVPMSAKNIPCLDNIQIVKYGNVRSHLWEQVSLYAYVKKNKAILLNMCSIAPLGRPDYIVIHDISYKVNPQYFNTFRSKISKLWHIMNYNAAWRKAKLIFTVSNYAKKEMVDVYGINPERIKVIGSSWEHFEDVGEDESIFAKYRELEKNNYFFSLGSLAPNKNIEWILEVAKKNPNINFVIAGKADAASYGKDYSNEIMRNVFFTGYISDEQIKSMMKNCRAFIFPSFYEGFGLPPLEAMSVGAVCIVSNTGCLPEIYGKSVHYIDPYSTDVDFDKLLIEPIQDSKEVLEKYSFKRFAKIILEEIVEREVKKFYNE